MQAAGREPEWQVYDEEGHGWLRLANQLDFAARLERFLGQHLK
jgi:dipeptidyl aminopeptidase/acylaminoacyl peptidase